MGVIIFIGCSFILLIVIALTYDKTVTPVINYFKKTKPGNSKAKYSRKSKVTDSVCQSNTNIEKLAKFQRYIIYSIIAMLILFIAMFININMAFLYFFVWIFQLYALGGLARQIGWHPVAVIIGLFFPFINLIILLLGSQKATNELKSAGCRVGLLGVSSKQLSDVLESQKLA
jgi:ABC-type multidrug transport system fused ATPase/permease subunit